MSETIISIEVVRQSLIIEAQNNVELIRIVEPNNKLIMRILKAALLLKLKSVKTQLNNWLNK